MIDSLDVRARIVRDCAELLPFAEDSAKALACRQIRKLRSLYTGRSQRRVIDKLTRLVDDLGKCRTVDDLPGPVEEVEELRAVSLEVFRGLTEYAGNPLGLTASFRNQAVDFFRGLLTRDPALLARVRKRRERALAVTLLSCAITLMGLILCGHALPTALAGLVPGFLSLNRQPARPRARPAAAVRHVEDGEAMLAERRDVLAWANDPQKNPARKLPHELALSVWRANAARYELAALAKPSERGYKDAKSLRAHFYPNRAKFVAQRRMGRPYAED